jgi:hypothetical protein
MAGYFSSSVAQKGIGSPYESIVFAASQRHITDPALIKAVISAESAWNPSALRAEPQINDASYGLMQILLGTARGMMPTATATDLLDPSTNVDLGTRYLAAQLNRFGYPGALAAYNGGPGNVAKWQVGQHPQQANVDRYVATVDSYYSWFIQNDPALAVAGTGPFRGDSRVFAGNFSNSGLVE